MSATVRAPEDQHADRRDALRVGFCGGIALTICIVVAVWLGLAGWRQSHDEQLRAEAKATVERDLGICRRIVDAQQKAAGDRQSYDDLVALVERIDAARYGR